MTVFNGERLEGIHRWHEWFGRCLTEKPEVKDCAWEIEEGHTCWRMDFSDGARVWVHVTDGALRVDPDDFDALVRELEDQAWYELLITGESGAIRIHSDGRIEVVEPDAVPGEPIGV
ncbi:MAG: hypothetical protein R3223_12520 [Longimicrobiales bacterium]|nr:hypothetical protein [Longimicrobiales bacterium]